MFALRLALFAVAALVFGSRLPANARLSAAESTVPFASPATMANTGFRGFPDVVE
jgi:hypothetical protein